jgi:hypothetical protein
MDFVRPSFLIIGAPKCGTTSLYHYLKQHPEVYLASIKETRFFSDKTLFDKGIDFYIGSFFGGYKGQAAVGEVCPEYMIDPKAHRRIFDSLGKIKILVIVRDPVDRAYSHYWMQKLREKEERTFQKAVEDELGELKSIGGMDSGGWIPDWQRHYVSCSLYARQVQLYLDVFGFHNVFCLSFNNFVADPRQTMREICRFISVNDSFEFDLNEKFNTSLIPRFKILAYILRKKTTFGKFVRGILPNSVKGAAKDILIVPGERDPVPESTKNRLKVFFTNEIESLRAQFPYLGSL